MKIEGYKYFWMGAWASEAPAGRLRVKLES